MPKYSNWQELIPAIKELMASTEGRRVWQALKEKSSDVVQVIAGLPEEELKEADKNPRFQKAADSLANVAKMAVRLSPSLDPYTKDLATLAIEIKLVELNQRRKKPPISS